MYVCMLSILENLNFLSLDRCVKRESYMYVRMYEIVIYFRKFDFFVMSLDRRVKCESYNDVCTHV